MRMGPKKVFGEDTAGGRRRKGLGAGEGIAVHFADLGEASEVDLFANELRPG